MKKKILIGITGATGVIYGIKLLEILKESGEAETFLVISDWGKHTIACETNYSVDDVYSLADHIYGNEQLGADISSGSFSIDEAVILPCTMKTLSAIANGYDSTLVSRAASVAIKEGRPLIVCPRETPLTAIHLENMLKLARLGVKIVPTMPSFYNKPETAEDIALQFSSRIADYLGITKHELKRWKGME